METYAPTTHTLVCYHCGQNCENKPILWNDKSFCCQGCKTVYDILQENQLCNYYELNQNPGNTQRIQVRENKFAFLDDENIQKKIIQFTDGKQTHVTFYLPQMHCSSCLWLLENFRKINRGIIVSRVNFPKKEVFLTFDNKQTNLRKVVEDLTSIGYEPHLSLQDVSTPNASFTDKSKIYKIGIAGFCFSNIMAMSFPEYFSWGAEVEKNIEITFKILSVLLSLPVLFYCSEEFFTSAWKGLKNRFINIDAPIALAVLITFLRSLYEITTVSGNGYLDSMSGIVFFMLLGRMLQDRTHHSLSFERDYKSFFPIAVELIQEDKTKIVEIHELKPQDIIRIHAQELIPVDAILSKGKASIDYSFVSGESLPVTANPGEMVYAGGKQVAGTIELLVVKEVSQSYLTHLWNKEAFTQNKKPAYSYIHDLSNYFTIIVLAIAFVAAAYWIYYEQYRLMWNALTTILIVACPCALLLSSTFTNGNILRILAKNKFYLRNPEQIEYLSHINHVVLDKTGTLTDNKRVQVDYIGKPLDTLQLRKIYQVSAQSNHPLSQAIKNHLQSYSHDYQELEHFKTHEGKGIEAWIDQCHIRLGSAAFVQMDKPEKQEHSCVYVQIDQEIYGQFVIQNYYREGLPQLIQQLQKNYTVSILSGDNDSEKKYLSGLLGDKNKVWFNQKPEDKLHYIEQLQQKNTQVLMLGDGLNDAGALRQSEVGVAVSEGNNTFTPASDGILDASQLQRLPAFLAYARYGKKVILSSFIISILYNIVGVSYAVTGTLSPLIAAILMPSSSISIILWTYGFSEWGAKHLKIN